MKKAIIFSLFFSFAVANNSNAMQTLVTCKRVTFSLAVATGLAYGFAYAAKFFGKEALPESMTPSSIKNNTVSLFNKYIKPVWRIFGSNKEIEVNSKKEAKIVSKLICNNYEFFLDYTESNGTNYDICYIPKKTFYAAINN